MRKVFYRLLAICAAAYFTQCSLAARVFADPQGPASTDPTPTATTGDDSIDVSPDFNAIASPRLWFSLEDEYSPNYDGLSGSSSQLIVRGQIPLGEAARLIPTLLPNNLQLIKIKVPFVTSAPGGAITGNGDTTLGALEFLGSQRHKWTLGPVFKLPTASTNDLGSGKWQIGPSFGVTDTNRQIVTGWFCQNFFSFAGPKSRSNVSQTQFQPMLIFLLQKGWVIGTSEMQFKYDWETNDWLNVPLGIRIAKSFTKSHRQLSAGFEAEKNLIYLQGSPGWTLRLNLKYRFLPQ